MLLVEIPITFEEVKSSGNGRIGTTPTRGLSFMNSPTCGLWRMRGRFKDERWDFGPTPLRRRSCGLPMAPALTIISPFLRMTAVCCFPFESEYKTPFADDPINHSYGFSGISY